MSVEPLFLQIKIESTLRLIPDEPDEYTSVYRLTLFNSDEDDENENEVGLLYALKVDLSAGFDAGYTPYDILECHSVDLDEFRAALVDSETEDFKEEVLDLLPFPNISKILVLHVCTIHPDHRGAGLGFMLAKKAIDVLGADCDLVVCLPTPVESSTIENGNVPETWLEKPGPDVSGLRNYWAKLGFKQIGDSKIFAKAD